MMSRRFWLECVERAVKSAAQSALLVVGAEQLDALSADWRTIGAFAAGGAVLSMLTSIASKRIGPDDGSPSVV